MIPPPPLHRVRLRGAQLELWDDDVSAALRQIRRPPTRHSPEWHAMIEAIAAPGHLAPDTTIALGDEIISHAGLPFDYPSAVHVAVAGADMEVCYVTGHVPGGACYGDGRLTLPRGLPPVAFAPWHETGEGVVDRAGLRHCHADVQRVALALMVASDVLERGLRRWGRARVVQEIRKRHRHAPSWALQLRLWLRDAAHGVTRAE